MCLCAFERVIDSIVAVINYIKEKLLGQHNACETKHRFLCKSVKIEKTVATAVITIIWLTNWRHRHTKELCIAKLKHFHA